MKKKNFSIPYLLLTSFVLISMANLFTYLVLALGFIVQDSGTSICSGIVLLAVSFLTGLLLPNATESFRGQKGIAVYLPVLVPFFVELLIQSFGSTQGFGWGSLFSFFFLLNQYIIALSENYAWIFFNLGAVLCFGLGERLSTHRKKTQRKLPSPQSVIIVACVFAAIWGTGKYSRYVRDLSTADYPFDAAGYYAYYYVEDEDSYGFPYERGWSSTDLRSYYVENPDNKLARLEEPASFTVSDPDKMPVLDGAEAAYPVYSAFANACYKDIAEIQSQAKADENYQGAPIRFTNTIEAYKKLLSGEVDIFFGARPSREQERLAEEADKKLILTPIAKEGFVFFVNKDNKIDGLTSEQIRDIYSGKITNWRKVGGGNIPILAFQRPENSGSQTMMQYFMGDVPLKEHLTSEYKDSMAGTIRSVADGYQNKKSAIGYSFRYFATQMTDSDNIKFLALDGVYPDTESIRAGTYPMTTQLYAITVEGNENENIIPFLEFMQGAQGQELIEKTGYVAK